MRPVGLRVHELEIDEEELQAIIDFQKSMASDAFDSGENEEGHNRLRRAKWLRKQI